MTVARNGEGCGRGGCADRIFGVGKDEIPDVTEFFDFCNEMLCVADHRGYFTKVNPAWTKTLGWSTEELTSRPYLEFVHPDDLEATVREARLLQRQGYETIHFQNRYRCKDGSYKWLAWQARAQPGTDELLATARDVSVERNQMEALRESEERFRSLADHAPIGIAQADAGGNVSYVNQRLCEIVGVEPAALKELGWQQWIHPQDRAALLETWRKHVASGANMAPQEFRMCRPDGQVRWVSCSVSLLKNTGGKVESQIVTIEDITDLMTAYQDLAEKEHLLRNLIDVQEKEKQHICYEFHDGLIQYAAGSLMSLEALQDRQSAAESAAAIGRIIQNLRRGVEEGRRVIRGIRPTVLDDLGLQAAIEDLIDQASASDVAIELAFDPRIGRLEKSLEATIYRVVQEAVTNVRKHSASDRATVKLNRSGGNVQIEVRDFGRGFDVDSSRQNGFGLLGMKERVRLLGGECHIKSEPGRGTTVLVRIPLNPADQEAAQQAKLP